MKSLLGGLSVSLWAAALTFSPSPAQAYNLAMYPSLSNYFSCSVLQSITPVSCTLESPDPEIPPETIWFRNKFLNTIPLSNCAGSCNGTESLMVQYSTLNGRKTAAQFGEYACLYGYLLRIDPCNTCS